MKYHLPFWQRVQVHSLSLQQSHSSSHYKSIKQGTNSIYQSSKTQNQLTLQTNILSNKITHTRQRDLSHAKACKGWFYCKNGLHQASKLCKVQIGHLRKWQSHLQMGFIPKPFSNPFIILCGENYFYQSKTLCFSPNELLLQNLVFWVRRFGPNYFLKVSFP